MNPLWEDRVARIEQAWNWTRANTWLLKFHSDRDADKLESEARSIQEILQHSMAELAAEKAWRYCFARLNNNQREHLMAWAAAINRIGRGTGQRAEIHRRNARAHMNECRDAVPAWIMPFHRLAETVDAKPEFFDIVIVDEASQSGPDTLALLYLAKQIIVVGDDQQISPEAVGIQREEVDLLSDRLIPDLPHRDALGVESSLFNQAVIRFGGRIILREHFRCVPEIIRFSNDLCYSATPLLPLRQYPPERLEPIVVRHITNGFREGGTGYARNKPEAEAIVESIVQCTNDPRYLCKKDDKHHPYGKLTFGVISLQGEEQSKLINHLLLTRLTPEEIDQRELVCGDAYAFQGDERDVIFLSMVAAPNQRFSALVKEADKQRFNVAASRARDQVWLFHTVTLNDLNPDCMRFKLLGYYSNPAAQQAGEPDWDKCDSDFEREVGRIIQSKRYRLIPQYEPFGPGGYRIDFVVEGLKSQLAVEVDGPHHDDPEQIRHDMARQRQLERCKWVFWRVSASSFYFDREKAMASLWPKLEELGIHPLAAPHLQPVPKASVDPVRIPPPAVTPPAVTPPAVTPPAVTKSVPLLPSVSRQQDLIPSSQMELSVQKAKAVSSHTNTSHEKGSPPSLREYILAARQKRPHGVLVYEEIGYVVLQLMPDDGRIERLEIIKKTADALEFQEAAFKRISDAIRRLEDMKKVSSDVKHIWKTKK
jgi:very-short-patch-repair endonuclease